MAVESGDELRETQACKMCFPISGMTVGFYVRQFLLYFNGWLPGLVEIKAESINIIRRFDLSLVLLQRTLIS